MGRGIQQFMSRFPMIFTILVIVSLYISYMFTFQIDLLIKPQINVYSVFFLEVSEKQIGFSIFIIFHLLMMLIIYTFIKVNSTCPGFVPDYFQIETRKIIDEDKYLKTLHLTEIVKNQQTQVNKRKKNLQNSKHKSKYQNFGHGYQNIENNEVDYDDYKSEENEEPVFPSTFLKSQQNTLLKDQQKQIKYCRICLKFKPFRTHHCSQCARCILQMDHHCSWVNNCIGFENYKQFFCLIFYATLLLLFYTLTYIKTFKNALNDETMSDIVLFIIILSQISSLILFIILTILCSIHIQQSICQYQQPSFISSNKTTLEFFEGKQTGQDQGCFYNWISRFGINPLCWILPLRPNILSDGADLQ